MPSILSTLPTSLVTSATATGLSGLNQTGALFSISFWAKRRTPSVSTNAGVYVHADNQSSPRNGIAVFILTDGTLRYRPWNGNTQAVVDGPRIVTEEWQPFALVADGSYIRFAARGVVRGQTANTIVPTASGTRLTKLGGSITAADCLANIELWDVRVAPNVAWTLAEIELAQDPTQQLRGVLQRLAYEHNWRKQGTGAQTLVDESGNGNNLTTNGTTELAMPGVTPDWRSVVYPQIYVQRFALPSSGAVIAASLSTSFSLSSDVSVSKSVASSLSVAFSTVQNVDIAKTLSSALSVVFSTTSSIGIAKPLSSALSVVFSTSSALVGGAAAIASSLSSTFTLSSTVSVPKFIASALQTTFTAVSSITVPKPVAAMLSVVFSTASQLSIASGGGIGLVEATLVWIAQVAADAIHRTAQQSTVVHTPQVETTVKSETSVHSTITDRTDG